MTLAHLSLVVDDNHMVKGSYEYVLNITIQLSDRDFKSTASSYTICILLYDIRLFEAIEGKYLFENACTIMIRFKP